MSFLLRDEEGFMHGHLRDLGACAGALGWVASRRPSEAWADVGNVNWMVRLLARTSYTAEKQRKVFRLLVLLGYAGVPGIRFLYAKERIALGESLWSTVPADKLWSWTNTLTYEIPHDLDYRRADLIRAAVPDIVAWLNEDMP